MAVESGDKTIRLADIPWTPGVFGPWHIALAPWEVLRGRKVEVCKPSTTYNHKPAILVKSPNGSLWYINPATMVDNRDLIIEFVEED